MSRRASVLAAVGVLLAILLFLRFRTPGPRPTDGPAPPAAGPQLDSSRLRGWASALPAVADKPPAVEPGRPPLVPIIDEITVEKQEICEGEENLVTVKAHTPGNAEDAFLHYAVGAQAGQRVAILGRLDAGEGIAPERVAVFGRDNVMVTAELPHFTVKPCKPKRRLVLTARLLPNSAAELELHATVMNVDAKEPFKAVRYEWSFGDGQTSQTTTPVATHDYAGRPEESLFSQLLLSCVAVAADGERVEGRSALQLLNQSFEGKAYKGLVKIYTAPTPRFPELGPDGLVRQRIRLWHVERGPIRLEKLTRQRHYQGDEGSPPPEELGVSAAFGTTTLPPAGIEAEFVLDTNLDERVFSMEYVVEGHTEDGYRATGNFAIMRPPPKPTRETAALVRDAVLQAKILKTRELLGKDVVNDEDIWRLEKEGAFKDLVVTPLDVPPQPEPPRSKIPQLR
jgi:hypothetical protein